MAYKNRLVKNITASAALWFVGITASLAANPRITHFEAVHSPNHTQLIFDLSAAVKYRVFGLTQPERFVLDIIDTDLQTELPRKISGSAFFSQMRHARRRSDNLRIVLDMDKKSYQHTVSMQTSGTAYRMVVDIFNHDDPISGDAVLSKVDEQPPVQESGATQPQESSPSIVEKAVDIEKTELIEHEAPTSIEQKLPDAKHADIGPQQLIKNYVALEAGEKRVLQQIWRQPDQPVADVLAAAQISRTALNILLEKNGFDSIAHYRSQAYFWQIILEPEIQTLLRHRPAGWPLAQAEQVLVELLAKPQRRTRDQANLLAALGLGHFEQLGVLNLVFALETSGHPQLADGFPVHETLIALLPQKVRDRLGGLSMAEQHTLWLLYQFSVNELLQMGVKQSLLVRTARQLNLKEIKTPEALARYLREEARQLNKSRFVQG